MYFIHETAYATLEVMQTDSIPASQQPKPPVGQNGFGLATMREIATRYNAVRFDEWLPTNVSDYGYLLNPQDTPNQFGVSYYDMGEGFSVTHSIADFIPVEVRASRNFNAATAIAGYTSVLDIAVPYNLPHAIVAPRVLRGIAGLFNPVRHNPWGRSVSVVQLEGDFSSFVDAGVAKGEEAGAFLYLAPNIMELLLRRGLEFTVEFIGSHIYVYHTPGSVQVASGGGNMKMSPEEHEYILREGLAIAHALVRAARPAYTASQQQVRIPRPTTGKMVLKAFFPFLLLLLPWLLVVPSLGMSLWLIPLALPAGIYILAYRWVGHKRDIGDIWSGMVRRGAIERIEWREVC